MPATKSLQDLFINLLKDVYYAEKQILWGKSARHERCRAAAPADHRSGV